MRAWLTVFLLLQLTDMVTTYIGVGRGLVELNQLAALAFVSGPEATAMLYLVKGVATACFTAVATMAPVKIALPMTMVLTIASAVVVGNNLWRLLQ